jgi:menaquinone-dependent protoporphyrinogen IX oxidase
MVDMQILLTVVLFVGVGIPTILLIVGKVISLIVSYFAKETVTLSPEGKPGGKALIVYEPGATGLAKRVAETLGGDLQGRGFEVKVAGIRSPDAKDTAGYNLLIYGTPSYLGRPTGAFKKLVKKLRPASDQVFGFYVTGTKGAPAVGLVPKAFLEGMKKPLEESGIQAREMAFIGIGEFDYPEFVNRLVAVEAAPVIEAQ